MGAQEDFSIAANKKDLRNQDITAPELRVIGVDGEQIGILSRAEALDHASAAGVDLVLVSPQAKPPVCRVMDYGKYVFEKNKAQQVARKKQKQIQLKEIKFRPGTDVGDYEIKLKNLRRFLEEGDKCKVTLRFRGREMQHQHLGRELLERVRDDLQDLGSVEQFPKMEGRQMIMVIAPHKK